MDTEKLAALKESALKCYEDKKIVVDVDSNIIVIPESASEYITIYSINGDGEIKLVGMHPSTLLNRVFTFKDIIKNCD